MLNIPGEARRALLLQGYFLMLFLDYLCSPWRVEAITVLVFLSKTELSTACKLEVPVLSEQSVVVSVIASIAVVVIH
jgi:hypothetical protein